tara:strand:+ start:6383 stop:6997 length:615 start_codon:yes stop_codon:yes gene_type:complete
MGSIKINNKEVFTSNTEGLHVGTDYPTGAVIAAHCFRTDDDEYGGFVNQGVYVSMKSQHAAVIFKRKFKKLFDTSKLLAYTNMPGQDQSAGTCGVGLVIDPGGGDVASGFASANPYDERGKHTWDHGISYSYEADNKSVGKTTLIHGISYWDDITAGEHEIGFGWNVFRTDNNENYPFVYFLNSPHSIDHQPRNVGSILLLEIK